MEANGRGPGQRNCVGGLGASLPVSGLKQLSAERAFKAHSEAWWDLDMSRKLVILLATSPPHLLILIPVREIEPVHHMEAETLASIQLRGQLRSSGTQAWSNLPGFELRDRDSRRRVYPREPWQWCHMQTAEASWVAEAVGCWSTSCLTAPGLVRLTTASGILVVLQWSPCQAGLQEAWGPCSMVWGPKL